MPENETEDSRVFGEDVWVYCSQHLRAHKTGWCTVDPQSKTLLQAKTAEEAQAECRSKGLELYDDLFDMFGKRIS